MKLGKANTIFKHIDQDAYDEQDKLQAIKEVLAMPTHNGITKDEILAAFRWLFDWAVCEYVPDINDGDKEEMITLPKAAFHNMIARMESQSEMDYEEEPSWFINVEDAARIVFEIVREYKGEENEVEQKRGN